VQAVAGQLAGVNVIADFAGLGGRGDQASEEGVHVLDGASDMFALMQQRGELGALVVALALGERVGLKDCRELPARA